MLSVDGLDLKTEMAHEDTRDGLSIQWFSYPQSRGAGRQEGCASSRSPAPCCMPSIAPGMPSCKENELTKF